MKHKTIIEQIKRRAVELALSQNDIAEKMGVQQPRISRWFGKEPPHSIHILERLLKAVDPNLVIGLIDKKKKK